MTEEFWETIPDFPSYEVSNFGRIFNNRTNKEVKTQINNFGHVKVSLTNEDGNRYDRSVAKLVGEAFVVPPNARSTQIIILDGNFANVAAENLAWRPPWYAWKYTRQLKEPQPTHFMNLSVANIITEIQYDSIIQAGMAEGLLFEDIWRSTYTGDAIYPYGSIFIVLKRERSV